MVWERIEQMRRQQEHDSAQRSSESERLEELRAAEAKLQEDKKRRMEKEARNTRIKILNESGILSAVRELNRSLEGKVKKHELREDLDEGRIKLIWGNNSELDQKRKGLFSSGNKADYSYIAVRASHYNPHYSLEISGADGCSGEFSVEKWQGNKAVVINALAKAFLNPRTASDDIREREIYSDIRNPFENEPRQM